MLTFTVSLPLPSHLSSFQTQVSRSSRFTCHPLAASHGIRSVQMTLTPVSPYSAGVSLLENEGAYAVMAAANALEAATGRSIIHLEIGQPGFPTSQEISQAATSALFEGQTKYSSPRGIEPLRSKIAEWTNERRNTSYTAENIIVGPGAKPGLFFTTLALIRGKEDEVIIPDPGFPTYNAMVQVAGGTVRPVRLRKDLCGFDMEQFESSVNEKTRLVVLNSPGNPTGGVMEKWELERIAQLAEKYDFWVMSDEIYSELCYTEYSSIASIKGMKERTIIVDGFSKSFCMTGWRLGWAIMPKHLAERVELLLVHSVGCTNTFVQMGGIKALEQGVWEGLKKEYIERRDLVVRGLNDIKGVNCEVPKGAFYCFADVTSFGKSSKEIADLLLHGGVAVLPGTDFGQGGEGYIRISYVGEKEELQEGLRRMKETLEAL